MYKTLLLFLLLSVTMGISREAVGQASRSRFTAEDDHIQRMVQKAQFRKGFELTGGLGFAIMNSDNESRPFGSSGLQPIRNNGYGLHLDAGLQYNLTPKFGIMGNLAYTNFKGDEDEAYSKDDITYQTSMVRAVGFAVYNLIDPYVGIGRNRHHRLLVPYVKAGVGLASYTSTSYSHEANGEKRDLPASSVYPAVTSVLPVGGGIKIRVGNKLRIAPDLTLNLCATDHLDNKVWEPGVMGKNDHFLTASVKVFYQLKPYPRAAAFTR